MQLSYLLTLSTIGASLVSAAAVQPKFQHFNVKRHVGPKNKLNKRSDSAETDLIDDWSYYLTTISIGSDSQDVDVLVDTGSNALFVINSDACSDCAGTFDTSSSDTYTEVSDDFSITYGSGTASGVWANDTVVIGGATVTSLQMGVATTYPADFGVLGLTTSPDDSDSDPSYENLPKRLKTDGTIDKIVYSFYAGDHGDGDGSLLFGALDHSKYTGSMYTVDMTSDATTVDVSGVNLDSSYDGVTAQTLFSDSVTALIDTGTSTTSLPSDAFDSLIDALGATDSDGTYTVDCDYLDQGIALNYSFSGVRISISLDHLIYQTSSTSCQLGVFSTDSSLVIGADALRSMYTVFDLESKQIGIAQADGDPGDEDIEVISSSIPT